MQNSYCNYRNFDSVNQPLEMPEFFRVHLRWTMCEVKAGMETLWPLESKFIINSTKMKFVLRICSSRVALPLYKIVHLYPFRNYACFNLCWHHGIGNWWVEIKIAQRIVLSNTLWLFPNILTFCKISYRCANMLTFCKIVAMHDLRLSTTLRQSLYRAIWTYIIISCLFFLTTQPSCICW